ncbi:TPA: hypothetical protein IXF43_002673 [Enterococcus faecium]|uniref:hypothetical protein n=1 Tax=Enterococcus faecium TaxID=1352 RepID=UPI00155DA417|nr:hypothetical protein [Enterococcus faecium]HAP7799481.1 hypothetical protein [Enterococcus faecium]HAQ1458733.1 hypothetical protein [Enterococcus faecium]HBK5131494.1 hypothetical protein [Enterococcus faecium]HBK5571026.1 hypothetical protein [Enterococcus faecium]HCK3737833.1 hypothetical protein [Enterococcus faecium]
MGYKIKHFKTISNHSCGLFITDELEIVFYTYQIEMFGIQPIVVTTLLIVTC